MNSGIAYKSAVGVTCIMLLHNGIISLLPVLLPFFVDKLQVGLTEISLIPTITTVSAFACSLFSGHLILRFNPKNMLLVSSGLACAVVLIFALAGELWILYIAGILLGFVMALGTNVSCAAVISAHFEKDAVPIIGIVFGIASLGAPIIVFAWGSLTGLLALQQALVILAISVGTIGIAANIIFLSHRQTDFFPGQIQQHGQGKQTLFLLVKTPRFFGFFAGIFFSAMLYSGFSMFAAYFWQSHGMAKDTSAHMIGIFNLLGTLIVSISGIFLRRYGIKRLLILIFFGYIAGLTLLLVWGKWQAQWLLVLAIPHLAMIRPAKGLASFMVSDYFEKNMFEKAHAAAMATYHAGSACTTVLVGFVAEHTGSFFASFLMLMGLALMAAFLLFQFVHTTDLAMEHMEEKK